MVINNEKTNVNLIEKKKFKNWFIIYWLKSELKKKIQLLIEKKV